MDKCWIYKTIGNCIEYKTITTGKPVSDVVFNIRSLLWPGLNVFYKDGEYFKQYIGDGMKYQSQSHFPSLDFTIPQDLADPEVIFETKVAEKKAEEPNPEDADNTNQQTDE